MTVQHPGTVQTGSYSIIGATGDVQLPGRMKATATVDAGFATVQIQLIIIGNQEWYTDPLDRTVRCDKSIQQLYAHL